MYNTGNNSRSRQTMDEHIAAIDFKKRKRNKDATWPK
jgi:hypothetical protein